MAIENTLQFFYEQLKLSTVGLDYKITVSGKNPAVFRAKDSRTLKISPISDELNIILELEESRDRVRIFRHKSMELTGGYRYRAISLNWVINFLYAYKKEEQHNKIRKLPTRPVPFSDIQYWKRNALDMLPDGSAICSTCDGLGFIDEVRFSCHYCKGTGYVSDDDFYNIEFDIRL